MRGATKPSARGAGGGAARSASAPLKGGSGVLPLARKGGSARAAAVRARRLYKRVLGLRAHLPRPVLALFKLGLYFKALLVVLIFARAASHSAAMAFPRGAVTPDAFFAGIRAAPPGALPDARVIVVTGGGGGGGGGGRGSGGVGGAARLRALLASLAAADHGPATVALDVWVHATSLCDALPWPLLPLYPLALVLFGPPRFDHAAARAAAAFAWPHGPAAVVASRAEPDWAALWGGRGRARAPRNETLVFVDAGRARAVAPAAFAWLASARARMRSGMQANVAVFALDQVALPQQPPIAEAAILSEAFLPATAVFSPTADAWATFLDWHARRARAPLAGPRLPAPLRGGALGALESWRVHPLRAWFAAFALAFEERVCHPVLPDGSALVLRAPGATPPGTGGGAVRLASPPGPEGLYRGAADALVVPEQPSVVKWDGSITTCDAPFGLPGGGSHSRRVSAADVIGAHAAEQYSAGVQDIAAFSRARGGAFVAVALVSPAAVPAAMSWVCGAATAGFVPPALVLVAADDAVARRLRAFLGGFPRLSKAARVVSLGPPPADADDPDLRGSAAYWRLMLRRTLLLRDLLNAGVALLHFSPHQAWLGDPVPAVRAGIAHGDQAQYGRAVLDAWAAPPEMVVARTAAGAVSGAFVYMRPSASTRHLWSEVAFRFYESYRRAADQADGPLARWLHGVESDRTLLTKLVLGRDRAFRKRFPGVRYVSLNRDLFVDAAWLDDERDGRRLAYRSETSRNPTVVNLDDPADNAPRDARARKAGLWFLRHDGACDQRAAERALAPRRPPHPAPAYTA